MDYLPRSAFSLIDVRHTMLDADLLSCKLELSMLDACFVGHIPGGADDLLSQFNISL
jgi:hypothetical protein